MFNYLVVGNDELGDPVGDEAVCPSCGKMHAVGYGEIIHKDGTRGQSKTLGFVKCGDGELYLVAIGGHLISKKGYSRES